MYISILLYTIIYTHAYLETTFMCWAARQGYCIAGDVARCPSWISVQRRSVSPSSVKTLGGIYSSNVYIHIYICTYVYM